MGSRTVVDASVYASRRQDFLAPNMVVTPNVFLNTASLAAYLARYMPAPLAGNLAAGIGGVDGNRQAPGIPLGTVSTEGALAGSDILLAATNVGDVRLWGADLSLEVAASDRLTLGGSWSYLSKQLFAGQGLDGSDVSTNTPRHKVQSSARYRIPARDFSAEARLRSVGAFRMIDGVLVGDVDAFTVADLEMGIAVPGASRAHITGTIQNVADKRHMEFVGHPVLGRLMLTRLRYTF